MTERSAFRIDSTAEFLKVDESLGIVFGFAAVCTENGEPFYDKQDEHLPEEAMLKASADFMENARVSTDMHARAGEEVVPDGTVLFAFPLTGEIAKALSITSPRTGLLIGMKPSAEVLAKCKAGDHRGFSIGGRYQHVEEVA